MFLRYVSEPTNPTAIEKKRVSNDAECHVRQVYRAMDRLKEESNPLTILVMENRMLRSRLIKLYSFMVRRLSEEEPTLVDLENNEEVGKIVKESNPELFRRLMKK